MVNPSLTDFCQELTGITQAQVDAAPEFPEALRMLTDWLESHGFDARENTRMDTEHENKVSKVCRSLFNIHRSLMNLSLENLL